MDEMLKKAGAFVVDVFVTIIGGVFYAMLWCVVLTIFIGSHRAVYFLPITFPIALVYSWRELIREKAQLPKRNYSLRPATMEMAIPIGAAHWLPQPDDRHQRPREPPCPAGVAGNGQGDRWDSHHREAGQTGA